ncbi:iron uptake system component EfeO [Tessaracoccus bendigoensis DSM 12906]|uniref:Iron uptake system component EfeO n=1 Tax=Tessaracoccus bendigoensis DSM 12906 TaxID=1123357 RepID=A0A1M6B500_9ACTN|nr:iron uptake system protein EfeO [Tessaracoccus bendigoensis]SHI43543.1 iron uptake system component EfeO [Tessaracoccus bendigoensis DSM 12906]
MNRRLVIPALVAGLLLTSACTDNTAATGDARTLTVNASDTECNVSAAEAPSGTLTFKVTNDGSKINEFYLLADDGLRIVAEIENIGPGLSRDLVLTAPAGNYFTACKPGMVGDGIRGGFTVTDSGEDVGPKGEDAELVAEADAQYASYVRDQVDQLLVKTQTFADLVKARDDDAARALYADARVHWERVETVAESFGDLDPQMDAREADLEAGDEFTGWHRLEKDLWPARAEGYTPMTDEERAAVADRLVADTNTLYDRTRDMTFTASDIANGAKGLLDEVATGKVTGEEEYWSRTDLWDFQANVDGAKVAWEGLRPLLQRKDEALDSQIGQAFADLQTLLDKHRSGDGFVTYDQLSASDVKELADSVNTLSEPLSKMAGVILS